MAVSRSTSHFGLRNKRATISASKSRRTMLDRFIALPPSAMPTPCSSPHQMFIIRRTTRRYRCSPNPARRPGRAGPDPSSPQRFALGNDAVALRVATKAATSISRARRLRPQDGNAARSHGADDALMLVDVVGVLAPKTHDLAVTQHPVTHLFRPLLGFRKTHVVGKSAARRARARPA